MSELPSMSASSNDNNDDESNDELIGKWVWYPDEAAVWSQAQIISLVQEDRRSSTKEYMVNTNTGTKKYGVDKVHKVDPSHLLDLDDICTFNDMHEAPLLDLLRRRFSIKKIYTYAGGILISLNPYEIILGLYDDPLAFFNLTESTGVFQDSRNSTIIRPHVYQIANNALKNLALKKSTLSKPQTISKQQESSTLNQNEVDDLSSLKTNNNLFNQSVIISGESGAGKTENSKHVLNFLIASNNNLTLSSQNAEETSFADHLQQILVESSIVLEAFGNAKTVRNDNSSRFGKYIKLLYKSQEVQNKKFPKLVSAKTETFLLEKSRLTYVGKGERSYHIFYQLLSGLKDENTVKQLHLNYPISEFKLVSQGECYANPDDSSEFVFTLEALGALHCSDGEIMEILKILSVILHLGNLTYETNADTGLVDIRGTTATLEYIAETLGLECSLLSNKLTTQALVVRGRGSVKVKVLSLLEVNNNVHALLKWLYNKLFNWIVKKINSCHGSRFEDIESASFIGILDIFGFEILKSNSFEQLCINFTNERLQQQFNHHIFVREQEMYRDEGLEWSSISFRDNQPVIDLISSTRKPLGLLLLLEEQGLLNRKPDDMALLGSFNQTHDLTSKDPKAKPSPDSIYSKPRFGNDSFNIKHFAGEVNYKMDGFIAKNNDALQDDLMGLIVLNNSPFLKNLMDAGEVGSVGYIASQEIVDNPVSTNNADFGSKKMAASATVSLQFRQQLDSLMTTLYQTTPHYIKCIKSNNVKQATIFDAALVNQQLRYSGVLELVRIRREGFPIHMSFNEFYAKYFILARGKSRRDFPEPEDASPEVARRCSTVFIREAAVPDTVQIGTSRIFLRNNGFKVMQEVIDRFLSGHVVVIQSKYRSRLMRRWYLKVVRAVPMIQSVARMAPKRSRFVSVSNGARVIKSFLLTRRLRRVFVEYYKRSRAARNIQKCMRAKLGSKAFTAKVVATIVVQSFIRRTLCRRRYISRLTSLKQNKASVLLQKSYRKFSSRSEFLLWKRSAVRLQSTIRKHNLQKKFVKLVKATILIQRMIRGYVSQSRYRFKCFCIVTLQCWLRMVVRRRSFRKTSRSAVLIQSLVRKFKMRRLFMQQKRAIFKCQAIARCFLAQRRYQLQYACIIAIQSSMRMRVAYKAFEMKRLCTIMIQTNYRSHRSYVEYRRTHKQIVLMQSIARRLRALRSKARQVRAIVRLQSFGRMIKVKRQYDLYLCSIIAMQTSVRRWIQRTRYNNILRSTILIQSMFRMHVEVYTYQYTCHMIVKLQSFGRRVIERSRYMECIISIIAIQALMRGNKARREFRISVGSVIYLQALARKIIAQRSYRMSLRCISNISKYFRRWKARKDFLKMKWSTSFIRRIALRFLRQLRLARRLAQLHAGQQTTSQETVLVHVANFPQDRFVRYRSLHFRLLLHSLLLLSSMPGTEANPNIAGTFNKLKFSSSECVDVDSQGRNSAHYLSMNPNYLTLRALANVLNRYVYKAETVEGLDEGDDDVDLPDNERVKKIKQHLTSNVGKHTLRQGYLKKKRGGMMWQKRWAVLTEDYIIYYKSHTTTNNPKFAIPLVGCIVYRVPGKDPVFELLAPNMGVKKSIFGSSAKKSMLFCAESEKDLQEWLAPLKSVTGVGSLRSSSPVNYVNLQLRGIWLNAMDSSGNTPVHTLVEYSVKKAAAPATARNSSKMRRLSLNMPQLTDLQNFEDKLISLAWLLEYGCNVNAQNKNKETALHLALRLKADKAIVRILVSRGADVRNVKDSNGMSAFDILSSDAELKKYYQTAISTSPAISAPIVVKRAKGFSYLSLLFGKQCFYSPKATIGKGSYLLVSVFNKQRQLLESPREIRGAAYIAFPDDSGEQALAQAQAQAQAQGEESSYIYWGVSWQMQTPLENVEPGTYVQVEYKGRQEVAGGASSGTAAGPATSATATTSFITFPLEAETIDSTDVSLAMTVGSPDAKVVNPILVKSERAAFGMEIVLSRLERALDVRTVLATSDD